MFDPDEHTGHHERFNHHEHRSQRRDHAQTSPAMSPPEHARTFHQDDPEVPQTVRQYLYNLAVTPKVQILRELRDAYNQTVQGAEGLEEAREKLKQERRFVDDELTTLTKENHELRAARKIKPRGLVEREVERLGNENKRLQRLLDTAEKNEADLGVLQTHNKAMHNCLRDIETHGHPKKENWQMITNALQLAQEACEAADARIAVLQQESEGLRRQNDEFRANDVGTSRTVQKHAVLAKRTATERAAGEEDLTADSVPRPKRRKMPSAP